MTCNHEGRSAPAHPVLATAGGIADFHLGCCLGPPWEWQDRHSSGLAVDVAGRRVGWPWDQPVVRQAGMEQEQPAGSMAAVADSQAAAVA